MRSFVTWVLGHRASVLGAVLVATLLALYALSHAVVSTSIGRLFFSDNPDYEQYIELSHEFRGDEVLLIGLEDLDVEDPQARQRLDQLVSSLRAIKPPDPEEPFIREVRSLLDAQLLTPEADGFSVQYAAEALEQPGGRERVLADETVQGVLLSHDGQHVTITVELYPQADRPTEQTITLLAEVERLLDEGGFTRRHLAGFPVAVVEMFRQSMLSLLWILPIVCILLMTMTWLLFRQFWPVLCCIVVALTSMTWTMGLGMLLDTRISIMHSIAPMVIVIIASSDVIHLCSAYLIACRETDDKTEAIVESASEVGIACMYTSLTTFVGFVSLSLIPTPVFRHLGILLGTGVSFALLLAMLLCPIVFSFLPKPAPAASSPTRARQLVDRILGTLERLSTQRPRRVVALFAALALLLGYGISQFTVETSITNRMTPDNPVSQDAQWFGQHFSSPHYLQIAVDTQQPDGLYDPSTIAQLDALHQTIETREGVDAVFSLAAIYRHLHRLLKRSDDPTELPQTRQATAQSLLLLEMSGTELEGLVDETHQRTSVGIRLQGDEVRAAYRTGLWIEEQARAQLGDEVEVQSTGILFLIGHWLEAIIDGQQRGLIFTIVSIAGMMMVTFRSVRIGLWSMIPNLLPLLALGGSLGLLTEHVDSDVLILFMLAIGIGVDDTIHFMMRYRLESQRTSDRSRAISRTFHFAGRAIVITTAVLTVGFVPLCLSDYLSIGMIGALLPGTLLVALAADLLLVPALVMLGPLDTARGRQPASEP